MYCTDDLPLKYSKSSLQWPSSISIVDCKIAYPDLRSLTTSPSAIRHMAGPSEDHKVVDSLRPVDFPAFSTPPLMMKSHQRQLPPQNAAHRSKGRYFHLHHPGRPDKSGAWQAPRAWRLWTGYPAQIDGRYSPIPRQKCCCVTKSS